MPVEPSSRGALRSVRARRAGLAFLLGAAIGLSACSAHSQQNAGKSSSGTVGPARSQDATNATGVVARATVPKGRPLTTPRQVVYTADLHVRVHDVNPASADAVSIVDGNGGYVFSQDATLTGRADATLVFKVPPDRFSRVLDRLAGLGTPLEKNIAASDVTDQVVDLEGRLKTATASSTRLRALLGNAQNVPDIVAIENELTTRESEVESLQGQLRVVQSRVQLATVTLVLTTKAPPHKAHVPSFASALSGGWNAFVDTAKVILAVVGATLPFLAFAAVAVAMVVALRRRRRHAGVLTP